MVSPSLITLFLHELTNSQEPVFKVYCCLCTRIVENTTIVNRTPHLHILCQLSLYAIFNSHLYHWYTYTNIFTYFILIICMYALPCLDTVSSPCYPSTFNTTPSSSLLLSPSIFIYPLTTHLWPFSRSKFNLMSDRVNLVAPGSPIECLLYLLNFRAIQYKLGVERLTRLRNSNVLRLHVQRLYPSLPIWILRYWDLFAENWIFSVVFSLYK